MAEPRPFISVSLGAPKLERLAGLLFWVTIGLLAIGALIVLIDLDQVHNHDDTDAPGEHSGLHPLTDALTGCQYLATANGVTPRLGRDGQPLCGGRHG